MAGFSPETLAEAGFPTISIDSLRVGETFRSDDRLIRPQDVEVYAFATDDHDPWYFEPGPWGPPIAHPTILANQALFLRHTRYHVPAGLHARMAYEFVAPIRLGTRARTTGEVVETYWRRDKPYMVTAYETRAEDGTLLVRGRFVQMLFAGDTAPPPGSSQASGGPPTPHATEPETARAGSAISVEGRHGPITVGDTWTGAACVVTQRKIDAYSGVRPGSIHTDPEWARAKGFERPIAQGMMSSAHVAALLTTHLGVGFVTGGTLECRFLRPVLADDELTSHAEIVRIEADAAAVGDDGPGAGEPSSRVHLEVGTRNQRGEPTLAGSATAHLPSSDRVRTEK